MSQPKFLLWLGKITHIGQDRSLPDICPPPRIGCSQDKPGFLAVMAHGAPSCASACGFYRSQPCSPSGVPCFFPEGSYWILQHNIEGVSPDFVLISPVPLAPGLHSFRCFHKVQRP